MVLDGDGDGDVIETPLDHLGEHRHDTFEKLDAARVGVVTDKLSHA